MTRPAKVNRFLPRQTQEVGKVIECPQLANTAAPTDFDEDEDSKDEHPKGVNVKGRIPVRSPS